ncbi:hypothetical protein SK128_007405 [Halocaridina rubra]|uniref:Uncharacterized protein n=1 Tax=Halocaridina rubra TaxID=373956 RepID=A0AAN9A662_HALRR
MIEVMKEYKIHPQIREAVAYVNTEDKTYIALGRELRQEMNVTSGIKLGCTGNYIKWSLYNRQLHQMELVGGFDSQEIPPHCN